MFLQLHSLKAQVLAFTTSTAVHTGRHTYTAQMLVTVVAGVGALSPGGKAQETHHKHNTQEAAGFKTQWRKYG